MHIKCRVICICRLWSGRRVYCSSTCGMGRAAIPVVFAVSYSPREAMLHHAISCLPSAALVPLWPKYILSPACELLYLCMQHCNMHGAYLHWWKHCPQSDSCPWHPGPEAWCGPAPPHDCPVAQVHNRADMTAHPGSAEQGSNEQHA